MSVTAAFNRIFGTWKYVPSFSAICDIVLSSGNRTGIVLVLILLIRKLSAEYIITRTARCCEKFWDTLQKIKIHLVSIQSSESWQFKLINR